MRARPQDIPLAAELSAHAFAPRLVLALYGRMHDDALLHAYLQRRFPGAPVIGGTSSGGFMTHRGVAGPDGIGFMLIDDPQGDYGVAAAPLEGDAAHAAERLLRQALADCGCSVELPELIRVYQAPGNEEAVVEGLRRVPRTSRRRSRSDRRPSPACSRRCARSSPTRRR